MFRRPGCSRIHAAWFASRLRLVDQPPITQSGRLSGLLGFGFGQTGSRPTAWAEAITNEGPSKGPGSFVLGAVPGVKRLAYGQPKARQTGLKGRGPSSLLPLLSHGVVPGVSAQPVSSPSEGFDLKPNGRGSVY